MAFKLTPRPTFTVPLKLSVPGQATPGVINVTFRHKTRAEYSAWVTSASGRPDGDFLAEVIESIDGLIDDTDQPIVYAREVLNALLNAYPASSEDLFRTYTRELTESRVKN